MSDVVNTTTATAAGVVPAAAPAPAATTVAAPAATPVLTVVAAAAPAASPAPSVTPAAAKPVPAHAAGRVATEAKGGESWLAQHRVKLMVAGFVLAAALGGIIAWVR